MSSSSSKLSPSKKADDCSCTPITPLTFSGSRRTSMPATSTCPSSAVRSPSRISTVVVLPAPLGPSRPKISRSFTRKEMPSTATRLPYRFRNPSTTIAKPCAVVPTPTSSTRVVTLIPETLSRLPFPASDLRSDSNRPRVPGKGFDARQHIGHRGDGLDPGGVDRLHLDGSPEGGHAQGAETASGSAGRQDVIGAGRVVSGGGCRVGAEEDRSGRDDLWQPVLGIATGERQVF